MSVYSTYAVTFSWNGTTLTITVNAMSPSDAEAMIRNLYSGAQVAVVRKLD